MRIATTQEQLLFDLLQEVKALRKHLEGSKEEVVVETVTPVAPPKPQPKLPTKKKNKGAI